MMTRPRFLDLHRGVSLVISMIILVILTLVVLSGVTMSTSNVKSTANMQFRDEALAAANVAVEQVVTTDFTYAPQSSIIVVDINQDGTNDYAVDVQAPVCSYSSSPPPGKLDPNNPMDMPCFSGTRMKTKPICVYTEWSVRAQVAETNTGTLVNKATGAVITVNQGIGVRKLISGTSADTDCQ